MGEDTLGLGYGGEMIGSEVESKLWTKFRGEVRNV